MKWVTSVIGQQIVYIRGILLHIILTRYHSDNQRCIINKYLTQVPLTPTITEDFVSTIRLKLEITGSTFTDCWETVNAKLRNKSGGKIKKEKDQKNENMSQNILFHIDQTRYH